ncbi:MAG TPA: hypothetical protein VN397_00995, partial [Candidatus Methylomirabilis sp.]|nr:hypothetical protein [Candidatus Methylomirabilis sp.]
GWPFLVMLAERVAGGMGAYLTALLVLGSAYPLCRLARQMNRRVGWATAALYLMFPTVLLYSNRGLFPNLPVVALAIWSIWAWRELGRAAPEHQTDRFGVARRTMLTLHVTPLLAGGALGLALAIRPTEALWILPWVVWAAWSGRENRSSVKPFFLAGAIALLVCIGAAWLAALTYPAKSVTWLPAIGYQLKDSLLLAPATGDTGSPARVVSLPFGFHPRAMWTNVRTYFFTYLAPWTIAALIGAFIALRRTWGRSETVILILCAWTMGALLLVYGQSNYADNIRGTVSLGNSFLRYLLPLVPIVSYAAALAVDALWKLPMRGRALAAIVLAFFLLYGPAVAFARDEEGILAVRRELGRYATIRRFAEEKLQPGTVIVSERSDKIFASGPFPSASPLPDKDTMRGLFASETPVALFHRTLSYNELNALMDSLPAFPPFPVYTVDNESMYLLQP